MENLQYFKIKDNEIVDVKISTKYYPLLTNMLARQLERTPDIMTKVPQWIEAKQKGGVIEAASIEESDFLLLTELANGILSAAKSQGFVSTLSKEEYEKEVKSSGGQGH